MTARLWTGVVEASSPVLVFGPQPPVKELSRRIREHYGELTVIDLRQAANWPSDASAYLVLLPRQLSNPVTQELRNHMGRLKKVKWAAVSPAMEPDPRLQDLFGLLIPGDRLKQSLTTKPH